jgi:hypothetical protein
VPRLVLRDRAEAGVVEAARRRVCTEGVLDEIGEDREANRSTPGGVWFVGLSLVNTADTIALAIAEALDMPEREGASPLTAVTAELGRRTSRRTTLLLLDNCEHLTRSCAATVVTLLAAATHLKLLCTSREPLHVPGERIMRIGPLSLPNSDAARSPAAVQRSEAVRLFLDRAGLADPGYTIDESNANQVADLCVRVDGMPLALELAGAAPGRRRRRRRQYPPGGGGRRGTVVTASDRGVAGPSQSRDRRRARLERGRRALRSRGHSAGARRNGIGSPEAPTRVQDSAAGL